MAAIALRPRALDRHLIKEWQLNVFNCRLPGVCSLGESLKDIIAKYPAYCPFGVLDESKAKVWKTKDSKTQSGNWSLNKSWEECGLVVYIYIYVR